MHTAQNESEAVPSWRVYFSQQREREREKERKSFECFFFFFCFVKAMMIKSASWTPSFFLFVCFNGSLWWRTCSEPFCRGRRSMPKEGEVERRSFFLPSFHILSCETLFLRGFKGDDETILAPPLKLQGVFDYSKCSEPKNAHIRDTFFSLIRSLTQYFLHTHKNTHTDAHRKHSLSWKHAGCIERKHFLW